MIEQLLFILGLAYLQNVSFTVVSRARNRNNNRYHLIASIFSNSIWYLTFRALILADMTWVLFIPYNLGTVLGSLSGAKVSMCIERWLHASSDDHLRPTKKFLAVRSLTGEPTQLPTSSILGPFSNEAEATQHFESRYSSSEYEGIIIDGIIINTPSSAAA